MGSLSSRPFLSGYGHVIKATVKNIRILKNGDIVLIDCMSTPLFLLTKKELFKVLEKYQERL